MFLHYAYGGIARKFMLGKSLYGDCHLWSLVIFIRNHHSLPQRNYRYPSEAPYGGVNRTNKQVEKKNVDRKVYMRDVVREISNILRYNSWVSAQAQLHRLHIKWDSFTVNQVLKTHPPMEKAWLFFNWTSKQKGFKHDQFTYTTMLDIFGEARRINSMKYVFHLMQEKGIKIDAFTYTSMLHWLSNSGDFEGAVRIWKEMRFKCCHPTVVSYTAYMKVLFDNNQAEEATEIYKEMLQSGLKPTCHTYTILMDHLIRFGKCKSALEVFKKMQETGVQPDKATCNILVEQCSKAGEAWAIIQILHYMKDNSLVLRYPIYLLADETLKMAGRIQAAFLVLEYCNKMGIRIEKESFLSLTGFVLRMKDLSKIIPLVEQMIKLDLFPEPEFAALLIYRLGQAKELDTAVKVFSLFSDEMKTTTLYTALISACFSAGDPDKGIETFKSMKIRGIPGTLRTYDLIIRGLEMSGRVDEAKHYRKEKKSLQRKDGISKAFVMDEKICDALFAGYLLP